MLSVLILGMATQCAWGQQSAVNPITAACGPDRTDFSVTKDAVQPAPVQAPPDKALVYVIETMPKIPLVTSKVNIGVDSRWIGETQAYGFLSVVLDPGEHHLCAVYQGHAQASDVEGRTLLLHLNVEAGKTYYLRYHGIIVKDSGLVSFFELVDSDEGLLLLQRSDHIASVEKK
jgi:hypothetical protein